MRLATRMDALRIAIALEGYAIKCADDLGDHDTAVSSEGHAGKTISNVPNIPELKLSVGIMNYKKARVADRLLTLQQEYNLAVQQVDFWWDVVGDKDAQTSEAANQTAIMGLRLLTLAKDVRDAFELPSRNMVFKNYDIKAILDKNVSEQA